MNRGSPDTAALRSGHLDRFNEAPIHESGKYRIASAYRRIGKSFNEAPIHESGKSLWRRLRSHRPVCASMRPRFMNRGSVEEALAGATAASASMRPRFMNRGSDEDASQSRRYQVLQ